MKYSTDSYIADVCLSVKHLSRNGRCNRSVPLHSSLILSKVAYLHVPSVSLRRSQRSCEQSGDAKKIFHSLIHMHSPMNFCMPFRVRGGWASIPPMMCSCFTSLKSDEMIAQRKIAASCWKGTCPERRIYRRSGASRIHGLCGMYVPSSYASIPRLSSW